MIYFQEITVLKVPSPRHHVQDPAQKLVNLSVPLMELFMQMNVRCDAEHVEKVRIPNLKKCLEFSIRYTLLD